MKKNLPLSYIELSRFNLIHNIKQFRKLVKKGTQIAGVVKANAYGHGRKKVVRILNPYVDYFQVNSVEELKKTRKVTRKPILLLGYVGKDDLGKAISLGCILSAFDLHHLLMINAAAEKSDVRQKVHIAIDAHLGREGIMPSQVEKFLIEAKKMKYIKIDGVYAHFANIEDTADLSHVKKQIKDYAGALEAFRLHGYKNIRTHISATSGVLAYEKKNGFHSIVRIGVGLYGMWPSENLRKKMKGKIVLKPVLRFISHVAQIKTLPKGHSIGYGLTFRTKKPTTIAVIPQGYSDGLPRLLSNRGHVLIRGRRAPILGRIAMNMFVVDVSHIKTIKPEDEVVLLGRQKREEISAEELARDSDTINYEVTTRLSPLLKRIVV